MTRLLLDRRPRSTIPLLIGVLAELLVAIHGQTATAQLRVELQKLDGKTETGRLISLSDRNVNLLANDEKVASTEVGQLVRLRPADLDRFRVTPLNRGPWVFLATGERLRLEPRTIDDTSLIGAWSEFDAMPPQRIPLEVCRGLSFGGVLKPDRFGQTIRSVMQRREASDLVRLGNGDQLAGEFIELTNNEIVIETDAGESRTPLSFSRLLAFNPELISVPEQNGSPLIVLLTDGSLLKLSSLSSNGDRMIGKSVSGFSIQFPVTLLLELRFASSVIVPLSSLPSEDAQLQTLLTVQRDPVRDASVLGAPMMITGRPHATGIGMLSGTRMTWKLDGEYQRLLVSVGLDDAASNGGSVVFEVLVDGESRWRSKVVRGGSRPVSVPVVDLKGAGELQLHVDASERGNVLDYANWCDAVLIREAGE